MTIDWDDVRYFLAVARHGSVRAAAARLDVNHTTVLRRIAQLEALLHSQLFEKLPAGYRLTEAGKQVQELAEQMEASSHLLVSRVSGRDQAVRGPLRVTMAPTLATHLLMPDFAAFTRQHPDIEMEIHSSLENVNLTNREADVALRVVFNRNSLPQNLHGAKGPDLSVGVYMSRDLFAAWKDGTSGPVRWISKNLEGVPDWAHGDAVEIAGAPFRIPEDAAHLEALRLGLGISALPSFVGDAEPLLVRVPGTGLGPHGTLWVLTQGETRKTKRVRLFTEFISERLRAHTGVLAGGKSR
ncbi:LysR family transcriptional regulator [Phyllobacterium sp. SB3]|uniref:LysR family transcriptional regulator n=1 Tax=Phyllobacterium sp. SB3 TaxID=3156073 RepID=UPI0032AEBA97